MSGVHGGPSSLGSLGGPSGDGPLAPHPHHSSSPPARQARGAQGMPPVWSVDTLMVTTGDTFTCIHSKVLKKEIE